MADKKYGYICFCGEWHEADAYAAAHWHIELVHTCSNCNRVNTICEGQVVTSESPDQDY